MIEKVFINGNEDTHYPLVDSHTAYPDDVITGLKMTTSEDTVSVYLTSVNISEDKASATFFATHTEDSSSSYPDTLYISDAGYANINGTYTLDDSDSSAEPSWSNVSYRLYIRDGRYLVTGKAETSKVYFKSYAPYNNNMEDIRFYPDIKNNYKINPPRIHYSQPVSPSESFTDLPTFFIIKSCGYQDVNCAYNKTGNEWVSDNGLCKIVKISNVFKLYHKWYTGDVLLYSGTVNGTNIVWQQTPGVVSASLTPPVIFTDESDSTYNEIMIDTESLRFSNYYTTWNKEGAAISTLYGKSEKGDVPVGWVSWGSGTDRSCMISELIEIAPTCIVKYNNIRSAIITSDDSGFMPVCMNINLGSNITTDNGVISVNTSGISGLDTRSVETNGSLISINGNPAPANGIVTLNLPTYRLNNADISLFRLTKQMAKGSDDVTILTIKTNEDIVQHIKETTGEDPLSVYMCPDTDSLLASIKPSAGSTEDATKELPLDSFLTWYKAKKQVAQNVN